MLFYNSAKRKDLVCILGHKLLVKSGLPSPAIIRNQYSTIFGKMFVIKLDF